MKSSDERYRLLLRAGAIRAALIGYGVAAFAFLSWRTPIAGQEESGGGRLLREDGKG